MTLLTLAGVHTFSAGQTIYRCTDAAGKVQLSDRLCDANAVDRARVVVRPNTLDASGERAQNRRHQSQYMNSRSGGPVTGRTEADLQADRSNSFECRQAQRELRVASGSIKPGHSTVKAAEHSMRAACGMREPTQVNVYNEAPRVIAPRSQRPLPFTSGSYNKAAGGYTDAQGRFCPEVAGGLQCPTGFVPIH